MTRVIRYLTLLGGVVFLLLESPATASAACGDPNYQSGSVLGGASCPEQVSTNAALAVIAATLLAVGLKLGFSALRGAATAAADLSTVEQALAAAQAAPPVQAPPPVQAAAQAQFAVSQAAAAAARNDAVATNQAAAQAVALLQPAQADAQTLVRQAQAASAAAPAATTRANVAAQRVRQLAAQARTQAGKVPSGSPQAGLLTQLADSLDQQAASAAQQASAVSVAAADAGIRLSQADQGAGYIEQGISKAHRAAGTISTAPSAKAAFDAAEQLKLGTVDVGQGLRMVTDAAQRAQAATQFALDTARGLETGVTQAIDAHFAATMSAAADYVYQDLINEINGPSGAAVLQRYYRRQGNGYRRNSAEAYRGFPLPRIRQDPATGRFEVATTAKAIPAAYRGRALSGTVRSLPQGSPLAHDLDILNGLIKNRHYSAAIAQAGPNHPQWMPDLKTGLDFMGETLGEFAAKHARHDLEGKLPTGHRLVRADTWTATASPVGVQKTGQFDQIYREVDQAGRTVGFIVIEAKGASAGFGVRQGYQQGRPEYLWSIIDEMRRQGGAQAAVAEELSTAFAEQLNNPGSPGRFRYFAARAKTRKTGTPKITRYIGYLLKEFDLFAPPSAPVQK